MKYTAFDQNGAAIDSSNSYAELVVRMLSSRFRFYFIADDRNEVVANELKGRPLPRRTSHGFVHEKAQSLGLVQ